MVRTISDEELMRRITGGCEASFSELYDRYGKKLYGYFYRMLGQHSERAEDFTQELFLKIVEKSTSFDPEKRFSTWIYTIAANMVKNEYRTLSRRKPLPEINGHYQESFAAGIDYEMFEKHLANALDTFGEEHRQCFILRYQEELSLKEIADILECPEGTVKSRLYYTIRKLSEKLRVFSGLQQMLLSVFCLILKGWL